VVAAPAYVEQHGVPATPEDLADHACLIHDTGPDSDLWHFTSGDETMSVRVSGSFIANNSAPVRVAALAGHGIAMLPELQVVDDVHSDRLVSLLTEYPTQRLPLSLVYPSQRNLASRTRVVMDFVIEQARQLSEVLATGSDVEPASDMMVDVD